MQEANLPASSDARISGVTATLISFMLSCLAARFLSSSPANWTGTSTRNKGRQFHVVATVGFTAANSLAGGMQYRYTKIT
jgi:hypothetical protein